MSRSRRKATAAKTVLVMQAQLLWPYAGEAHSQAEAYIASSTSPPCVGKQLTVLLHTQQRLSRGLQCSTNNKLHIQVLGHGHLLGSIDKLWIFWKCVFLCSLICPLQVAVTNTSLAWLWEWLWNNWCHWCKRCWCFCPNAQVHPLSGNQVFWRY